MAYFLLFLTVIGYFVAHSKAMQAAGFLRKEATYPRGQRCIMSALLISTASCVLGLSAVAFLPM